MSTPISESIINIPFFVVMDLITPYTKFAIPILLVLSLLYFIYSIFKRIKANIETKRKANIRIVRSVVFVILIILIWFTIAILSTTTDGPTKPSYFKDSAYITYPERLNINAKTGEVFRLYPKQKAIIGDIDAYIQYTGSSQYGWGEIAIYDFKYLYPQKRKDDPKKDGYCVFTRQNTNNGSGDYFDNKLNSYFDFIIYKNEHKDISLSCDSIYIDWSQEVISLY